LWATIVTFVDLPDNVKEKSNHFQYLVSTLARISSNLASQHDSSEGALTRKTSTALTESAKSPLYHKQVQKTKRRQRKTWSQRSREPKTMIIHSAAPQSLNPSGRGNDWRTVWGGIITKAPKTHIDTPAFCWALSLVETSFLRPGASGLCDVGYDITILVDMFYSAKVVSRTPCGCPTQLGGRSVVAANERPTGFHMPGLRRRRCERGASLIQ
ncbi:hypothetical protein D6C90_09141, partial [Aureobasidium pullulans]